MFEYFKKINAIQNGEIDVHIMHKYWEEKLKTSAEWLKVLTDALLTCNKEVTEQLAEIQKRSKFTVEQCNMKFESVFACLHIKELVVSFTIAFEEQPFCHVSLLFIELS